MRLLALIPAALLVACGETATDADDAAAGDDLAWTEDLAACGLEAQDRVQWGADLVASGHEMQEVTAEPGLVLRVWSGADAALDTEEGVLTGEARGPAWIAVDVRPNAYMVHLADGAAGLRVTEEGFFCAPTAQPGQ